MKELWTDESTNTKKLIREPKMSIPLLIKLITPTLVSKTSTPLAWRSVDSSKGKKPTDPE
jgi:hypothetical protein